MSQSPLATRLRQEAQALEWAASRVLDEAEALQDRVTAMKREARQFRERADEIDDAEEVSRHTGNPVLPLRRLAG